MQVDRQGAWKSFCVVCRRPIVAQPADPEEVLEQDIRAVGQYAYVVVLWGASPGFVLGAIVLAKSLRDTGTTHDLVLLYTSSIPSAAVDLLKSAGWKPREVEPISGVQELYDHDDPRFRGVFTKLHVMALYEYEKVLCMDIDTLVIRNMDGLFDLEAPAATGRGAQDTYQHGDPLDGSSFFRGGVRGNAKASWGQCWGINAGVMLLSPNKYDFGQMMFEVSDPKHPSHIAGNGPEQDYLSRYYADCWKHIGVQYNFQLHQMFFILHTQGFQDPRPRLMRQFLQDPSSTDIHLMHYSGQLKPWDRWLHKDYSSFEGAPGDTQFLRCMLESWTPYWLWVRKDPATVRHKGRMDGVALGLDGHLYWTNSGEHVNIPEDLVRAAESVVEVSVLWWNETYRQLGVELGLPGRELAKRVEIACGPPVSAADTEASGWRSYDGWWVEHPITERATIIAGCFPCAFATITASDCMLLDARDASASGVYAAAFSALRGPLLLRPDDDVSAWSEQVPCDSAVLMAFVAMSPRLVANVLHLLVLAGFGGVPTKAAVPADCGVLVLAGYKGSAKWGGALADAHFAKATLPLPMNALHASGTHEPETEVKLSDADSAIS